MGLAACDRFYPTQTLDRWLAFAFRQINFLSALFIIGVVDALILKDCTIFVVDRLSMVGKGDGTMLETLPPEGIDLWL
jgi:hypothetical protein